MFLAVGGAAAAVIVDVVFGVLLLRGMGDVVVDDVDFLFSGKGGGVVLVVAVAVVVDVVVVVFSFLLEG